MTRYIDLSGDSRFDKTVKSSKYGNTKTVRSGIVFDSKKEEDRWDKLFLLQRCKVIKDLERQVKFELIPAQKDEDGKVIERAVTYIADFVYTDIKTGQKIVEDTKGFKTKEYIIKRKLMLHRYGIQIREV